MIGRVGVFLSLGVAYSAAVKIPVLESEEALNSFRDRAFSSRRVFLQDLMRGESGVLLRGNSEKPLPPGCYRLITSLALSPLHHPFISDLSVTLSAGGKRVILVPMEFPGSDEFVDFSVDFSVTRTRSVRCFISWSVGKESKLARARGTVPKAPALSEERAEEGEVELELGVNADGTVSRDVMKKVKFHLASGYIAIYALSSIAVTNFETDKLIYTPGETAHAELSIRNFSRSSAVVRLSAELVRELDDRSEVFEGGVSVSPSGTTTVRFSFSPKARGGYALEAHLSSGRTHQTARTYFSVSRNFFEVGIGYPAGPIQTGRSSYPDLPQKMRNAYSNMLEVFFWAPCDWSKLVSALPEWWSGQTDYHENEQNLLSLIRACHSRGIKVLAYVSCNPAGPFGWEVARRHPEWFKRNPFGGIAGLYNVEHLDKWNNPQWRKQDQSSKTGWYRLSLDLTRTSTLDYGIDQIIGTLQHYRWDAIRFDGHYTVNDDEHSTLNMRRLKERVWKVHPSALFGFNYGRAPEWVGGVTHEMREAMAGGGLYLQEGIRNWRYTNLQYQSWSHYSTNELRIAKLIQSLGGYYHCIWDLQKLSSAEAYYKLIYGLIAGGHPFYGSHLSVPGSTSWGAFLTRWSCMLWDGSLRKVKEPERIFSVSERAIQWKPFVQERTTPMGKFIILHLVNPPRSDKIPETAFPPHPRAFDVVYRWKRPKRVFLVRPEREPFGEEMRPQKASEGFLFKVAGMHFWAMLIFEIEGKFSPAPRPPRFTEPPRFTRRPAPEKPRQNELVIDCDRGSVNIGRPLTRDPDSPLGTVQWRRKDQTYGKMGMWWMGPLKPGVYQISFRFKWKDPSPQPVPQRIDVIVREQKWENDLIRAVLVTPDYPDPPANAILFTEKDKYQDYILGKFELRRTSFIHSLCHASTTRAGEHTVYLERIKILQLEAFPDSRIADLEKLAPKPENLRQPRGDRPEKILAIRGMFWKQYLDGVGLTMRTSYSLPSDYRALYSWDAIILCNIDFHHSSLAHRRMLKEFVFDGGRLVFLGGPFALGQGGIKGTFIEEILPATCRGAYEVVKCEPPLLLGFSRGEPAPDEPAVFWRHIITPREGGRIVAWAGGEPIALKRKYGKGIVSLMAGTVLGEAEGYTPFWQTGSWRSLIRRLTLH